MNSKLTKTEINVLQQFVNLDTAKEVADTLKCSKRTVDFHIANITKKLDVGSRHRAMIKASQKGYIKF